MLAGAYDFILKDGGLAELEGALRRAVANADARRLFLSAPAPEAFAGLVGESPPIRELKALLARYAASDAPVLIQGESGSGKELAAQALHRLSPRREGPLLPVNCGAIPESLLESELFGAERGAFTDAVSRAGCFERANRGTIFLDEIGELAPAAQVKLLRVLESQELTRVGHLSGAPERAPRGGQQQGPAPTGGEGAFGRTVLRVGLLLRMPHAARAPQDIPCWRRTCCPLA
jgi:DNA-binding NtrC family response regulator